jgi:hypothetical protein
MLPALALAPRAARPRSFGPGAETALTPGPAISERAVRDRLRMFILRQQVSERTRVVSDGLCGRAGRVAISPDLRFEVKEAGEIDVVSMALRGLLG